MVSEGARLPNAASASGCVTEEGKVDRHLLAEVVAHAERLLDLFVEVVALVPPQAGAEDGSDQRPVLGRPAPRALTTANASTGCCQGREHLLIHILSRASLVRLRWRA